VRLAPLWLLIDCSPRAQRNAHTCTACAP
jgi:hypothetical protein